MDSQCRAAKVIFRSLKGNLRVGIGFCHGRVGERGSGARRLAYESESFATPPLQQRAFLCWDGTLKIWRTLLQAPVRSCCRRPKVATRTEAYRACPKRIEACYTLISRRFAGLGRVEGLYSMAQPHTRKGQNTSTNPSSSQQHPCHKYAPQGYEGPSRKTAQSSAAIFESRPPRRQAW